MMSTSSAMSTTGWWDVCSSFGVAQKWTPDARALCGDRASAGSLSCFRLLPCRWGIIRSGGEPSSSGQGRWSQPSPCSSCPRTWCVVRGADSAGPSMPHRRAGPAGRRVPPAVGVAVSALLFWVTYPTMNGFWTCRVGVWPCRRPLASYPTAYLGFMPKSFSPPPTISLPLPWLFLFWAGYFLHHLVGRGRPRAAAQVGLPAAGLDGPSLAGASICSISRSSWGC